MSKVFVLSLADMRELLLTLVKRDRFTDEESQEMEDRVSHILAGKYINIDELLCKA